MGMDLDGIRALLAVAEAGSFQSAARALGWPRATVRRRVDALESSVGVPLLHRDQRGAQLTDAGHHVAQRGRRVIREVDALVAGAQGTGLGPSGEVRVVAPIGLPPWLYGPLMNRLVASYPHVRWRVSFVPNPLREPLADADLVLSFGPERPAGDWVSVRLPNPPWRLLASPAYLDAEGTPQSVEALRGHRLLGWEAPQSPAHIWRLGGEAVEVPLVVRSNDVHFLRRLARASVGIAYLPDGFGEDPDLPASGLVSVLDDAVEEVQDGYFSVPVALQDLEPMQTILAMVRAFAV